MTTTSEIERLLHYMQIIVRSDGISDWERKFCASMVAAQRRRGFLASSKQIACMSRIVKEFQNRELRDDVIEDGEVSR